MADRSGHQLGNYRLVRLLGQGGFAEVYLGEHIYLGTEAAVKLLHTQLAGEDLTTFRTEARTVARLEHPHIVRVLEFGIEGTVPFLVMGYAPNGSLRERHPTGTPLPLETLLSYVKQVAEALQYAHDEKLMHRDIKPENMLLGRRQEVLLSDFGIALVAQSTRMQSVQEVVGTVAYMAPEMLQGKPRLASDQYALGIVVYEWLCGERPFHGGFTELASQHLFVAPPSLREKMPSLAPDIERVVFIALAKDPHQRFASVQAFATALEQASQVEPTVTILASHSSQPTELALAPNESLIPTELVTPASLAPTKYAQPSPPPSALAPTVYVSASPPASTLPPTQRASVSLGPRTVLCTYREHTVGASAVAWSPDGKRIASGSDDGIQVWEAATGQPLLTYRGHSKRVTAVAWSPDGKRIASGSYDNTVQVWNVADGGQAFTYRGHTGWVKAVAWSPDGTRIASGSQDATVQVWDATTGKLGLTYNGHATRIINYVNSVAWSPDGKRIASADMWGSQGRWVEVWDAATGQRGLHYRGHSSAVTALAWSPDGTRIATGSTDKTVQVWDVTTGQTLVTYRGHTEGNFGISALAWLPNGTRIGSGSFDKTIQVWDVTVGQTLITYDDKYLALSPDGKRLASSSSEGIQVWEAATGQILFTYGLGRFPIAWSPDGSRIASESEDNTVQVWQVL